MIVLFPTHRSVVRIVKGRDGQFYVRCKSPGNHEITLNSEGHTRRADAERAARAVTETKFTFVDTEKTEEATSAQPALD